MTHKRSFNKYSIEFRSSTLFEFLKNFKVRYIDVKFFFWSSSLLTRNYEDESLMVADDEREGQV
jgi:hypothetical protein